MTDYSHVLTEELFFFFKRSSVILLYDGFYVWQAAAVGGLG
jgi:hypothetical protein